MFDLFFFINRNYFCDHGLLSRAIIIVVRGYYVFPPLPISLAI